MKDEYGEYVWRTIRGARVKIYKNKTLKESIKIHKDTIEKNNKKTNYDGRFEDKKSKVEFVNGRYQKITQQPKLVLKNGKEISFLDKKKYEKLKNEFYNTLTDEEKKVISAYMSSPDIVYNNPMYKNSKEISKKFEKIFKTKAVELKEDTLLFRRSRESTKEIKEGITRKNIYTSTSAYDNIPKTMPSGYSFGDKEFYIIAPKGTKVLPIEKVGVEDVADYAGEKNIFARQHEILLDKNVKLKMLKDKTTSKRDYLKPSDRYMSTIYNYKYVMILED